MWLKYSRTRWMSFPTILRTTTCVWPAWRQERQSWLPMRQGARSAPGSRSATKEIRCGFTIDRRSPCLCTRWQSATWIASSAILQWFKSSGLAIVCELIIQSKCQMKVTIRQPNTHNFYAFQSSDGLLSDLGWGDVAGTGGRAQCSNQFCEGLGPDIQATGHQIVSVLAWSISQSLPFHSWLLWIVQGRRSVFCGQLTGFARGQCWFMLRWGNVNSTRSIF